jgi:hypothetical protein
MGSWREFEIMIVLRLAASAVVGFFALAACGGSVPGTAGAGSLPGTGGAPSHRTTHARLRIKVPPQKHRRKIRVHGHYISPATASLTYAVTPALSGGSTSGEIDISTSNPACQTTGVVGYLACTIDIPGIVPGTPYTFSFITWDAAGGTGNQLSANDTVPFTANAGQSNVLQATLGGIAASFAVTPMTARRITGSNALYDVYGNDPVKFSVAPIDADDNFIIGPGAPQPAVTPGGGAPMAIATVGPNAPNEWTLTSSYAPSDPSVPSNTTLVVSATPVPGSGGSTVNATIPISLYQPWIYAVDGAGIVHAYDEDGNAIASFSVFAVPNGATGAKQGIAFGNHRIYAWGSDAPGNAASNYIAAFPPQGGAAIASADQTTIPAIGLAHHPGWITFDPANGELYTQDETDGFVFAFDGGLTTNLASNNAASSGGGLAYVPSTQQVAITVNQQYIGRCDEGLASCSNLPTQVISNTGLGFDPLANFFGICSGYGGVQLMDLGGSLGVRFGSDNCNAIAFDPYNARWYANVLGQTGVDAYAESGSLVPLSGTFPGIIYTAQSVVVAP